MSKFFGSKIETMEDNTLVVSVDFSVNTAAEALALQQYLVNAALTAAAKPAAAAEPPKTPVAKPAPAAEAAPKAKPAAEAAKPAPKAKPTPAPEPDEDDEDEDDGDEDGDELPEELAGATTLKEVVQYFVDQGVKSKAIVGKVEELRGQLDVVDKFDAEKLKARVMSIFAAVAD